MWGGGRKEKEPISNALKEREMVKFPLVKENKMEKGPPPQRKRQDKREETRAEKEYDVVFGDWCFLSGSESDESDWSIGWSEPLGSNFQSNDNDDGFAVLVPCYTHGCKKIEGSKNVLLSAIKNLPNEFSSGK